MRRILIGACVLTAACGSRSTLLEPIPAGLLSSPLTITVGGSPVVLSFDYVTTTRERGVGLLGIVETTDGTHPSGASVGRAWLVHGDLAWVANSTRVDDPLPPDVIEKFITAGGPMWPLGDSVDVVVEVRVAGGTTQLLRGPRGVISPSDPVQ